MTVGKWLHSVALGQYAAMFRERKIDWDVLPELTEADLKRLGMSLGSRKRLMQAIADLETPSRVGSPACARPTPAAVERRPITFLFCDFETSKVAAQFEMEDWRNFFGAYLDAASAAVRKFDGRVMPGLGDSLMAVFGYPQAREDDAERAVRAALAIQQAIGTLNAKSARHHAAKLSARIGLDSGKMVVDSMGGVFGRASSIAARVEAAAELGSVLVTGNVQRQVAGLFVVEDRGACDLKDVPQPVNLYRILRVATGRRKSGARPLTPLAGREEELALLMSRWERARAGEGQLALVVGEPGIGKSRLLWEFHARLSVAPYTWIDWNCSQLLQNSPLHPITEWGRQRFDAAEAPAERLAELEKALTAVGLEAIAPVIAPLVDIPLPSPRVETAAPDELRRRQFAAIESWIMAGSRAQPLVLVVEDLQWSDPTSLDLLSTLAESGAGAPLFIVATARPEFSAPWTPRPHHALIDLAPLDSTEVRMMVDALASGRSLARNVIDYVSERTGGVPLFVEEVTRLILERGEQSDVDAIPPTLQQSLAARLDGLAAAREIAEIGSVLGREFSYVLLRDVSGLPDASLQASLARLTAADILVVAGAPPQASYQFKHALIQDAAYETLIMRDRLALHLRAAEALRDSGDARAPVEPETIAYHFTQAGRADLAIEWWAQAGEEALRHSAFREAIAHLGKAIQLADEWESTHAPAAFPASSRRLKLQSDYAQALMWSKGFPVEETKAAFARVRELAAQSANARERFSEYNGRWVRSYTRGELRSARKAAEAFLSEAEAENRAMEAGAARRVLGLTCLSQGEFATARSHLEKTLADYEPDRDHESRHRFSVDTASAAAACLSLALWHLGDVERANTLMSRAVTQALEAGHVPTVVNVCAFKARLDVRRDDPAAAMRAVEVYSGLARQNAMAFYLALGDVIASWARGRTTGGASGATDFRRALAIYTNQGAKADTPYFHGLLGKFVAESGDRAGALALVDQGLRFAHETGERWSDPELYRIRGEFLSAADPVRFAAAEDAFETAIAVALGQGSRIFGLRAALALAKLRNSSHRSAEAAAALAAALESFSPTPALPEIDEALTLLEALKAPQLMG
ncbi:MAG: AAA family ATPase [Hyphomicrobiales bacterium]|nr:AAA family ATPase [Hyphomicrobiales bacterium]MBV8441744.1 AAA family ATPase [Hyphomicrobiales bacterium]